MRAPYEKEVTCPLHATMMQTFAAPAYNIVLIVYLLSLQYLHVGKLWIIRISDSVWSLTIYDMGTLSEITITASHGLAHHHSIRISDAGLL